MKGEAAEGSASTRHAAERRGGEEAAITLCPCWLEREHVAEFQKKHQEQTAQVQQG